MKEFTVQYLDGKIEKLVSPSLSILTDEHFEGSSELLKKKVKTISWRAEGVYYTRDVQADETSARLISADVNPYGWRNA
jgi:hypothetical protein